MELQTIENVTWVATVVIVLCTLISLIYVQYVRSHDDFIVKRRLLENLPTFISTLGVIGTFLGITLGLLNFDTNDLDNSIPLLLESLKTAFFTSLAGMVGSIILNHFINSLFDNKEKGVSDINQAAGEIVNAVRMLQTNINNQTTSQQAFFSEALPIFSTALQSIQNTETHNAAINRKMDTMSNAEVLTANNTTHIIQKVEDVDNHMSSAIYELVRQSENVVNRLEESVNIERSINSIATDQARNVGEMMNHTEALVSVQEDISQHVSKFGEIMHGEVIEIEDKMDATNKLLTEKFEEFAELLKKSNTEALVEVMKKVTEEFQKQMGDLIDKLVKENFDQLNKSVEKLNIWQQENKEMIQSLTSQYKQMAENFENTSMSLTKVDEDTRQLVSEGGKLHQIVDALNKVIIEDEKFIKISSDLQKTTELTKTSYEQFDAATKSLNDWVKKQRNFVDGVVALIEKLDELKEIKNYTDEFWSETREGMNDAVSIVRAGTEELNTQVGQLNSQFYARLSTTLAQLDNCIQALIERAED